MTQIPVEGLPAGLATRPLQPTDSLAVYELMARCERHDIGSAEIEEADLLAEWGRPSFDITTSTVGVYDGGGGDARLVAYAELSSNTRADAAVDPDFRRSGIGTALTRWVRATARARGST